MAETSKRAYACACTLENNSEPMSKQVVNTEQKRNTKQTIPEQVLKQALIERHGAENQEKLSQACVGVAGLGGLGSTIAIHLTRFGVGALVLADFDVVDVSNLNRQHYFIRHLGMPKTEALAKQIYAINPYISLKLHTVKVTPDNASAIFKNCAVVCEAFDKADEKAKLVETLLTQLPQAAVVSGSGMAGFSSANTIRTSHPMENLYVCGDKKTDLQDAGTLFSSRVAVCAGHQANMVLRLLLGQIQP